MGGGIEWPAQAFNPWVPGARGSLHLKYTQEQAAHQGCASSLLLSGTSAGPIPATRTSHLPFCEDEQVTGREGS